MRLHKGYTFLFLTYVIATLAVAFLYQSIHKSNILVNNLIPRAELLFCAFFILIVYLIKQSRLSTYKEWIIVLISCFFLTTLIVFLFRHTYFGLNGVYGDPEFITASITKYASYWTLVDFNYKNLSAFYPPIYFYVMGKISWLLGIEPYKMLKIGIILVSFLLPPFLFYLWSKVVGSRWTVLIASLVPLVFFQDLLEKPYELITMTVIVPWWFLYVEPLTEGKSGENRSWRFILLGGFLGSLIFQTYYYWFFGFGTYLILNVILYYIKERSINQVIAKFKHVFLVLGVTFIFSLGFIGPLLVNFIQYGVIPSQNRWFRLYMLEIPIFKLHFKATALLYLIGFIVIVLFRQKEPLLSKLSLLAISCYIWFFLGYIGIGLDKPLLHIKIEHLLSFILFVGFCYLITELATKRGSDIQWKSIYIFLLLFLFVTFGQSAIDIQNSDAYKHALKEKIPKEVAVMKKLDYRDKVLLSQKNDIYTYIPVFNFLTTNVNYSHHSGQRDERVMFLKKVSEQKDPQFIAWMLTYNRFNQIDYIWLEHGKLKFAIDNFPKLTPSFINILFAPEIFKSQYFKQIDKEELYEIEPVSQELYKTFNPEQLKLVEQYASQEIIEKLSKK